MKMKLSADSNLINIFEFAPENIKHQLGEILINSNRNKKDEYMDET